MSENINDLCGTFNGRPIAGYHRVKYGETQEYLESLAEAGYILMYSEDNPKEEGKLTVAKPNAMPEYLKDYATNVVYDEYGNFISCSVEGLITLAEDNTEPNFTGKMLGDLGPAGEEGTPPDPTDTILYPGIPVDILNLERDLAGGITTVACRVTAQKSGDTTSDFYPYPISTNNVTVISSGENLPDQLVWTVTKPEADTTDTETTTLDTTVDPGSLDGPNPIGGGHHQYHFVQYGETQEYLESLVKEGYMMVYHEDNPPEEGKLTISKPNPDPEPGTITITSVANPTDMLPSILQDPADTTVTDTTDTTTDPNNWADGPGNVTVHIKPEYAKLLEEYKNVKARAAGYGRGQALFRFIYDSDDAETPSGYELVRTESWSGPDCTDEQIADIARYIINNDISDEQQKALMLEAVDAFLANPKMAQSVFDLTFISTKDAETEAVTSVQVACAEDDGWRTVGVLNNPDGIDWKYKAGNLTGSGTASVVWHAQELGALGVWTDGTDNWTGIAGWFDANWTMLGCGDFDGDGKDSVLMSLSGGQFYSVDLDGTLTALGGLNWSGWEFGAVGDFAGDGKDDVVLFHRESGAVVLLADGNADNYKSIGQLDASDWSVAGVCDFDSDGIDDLLVRQNSTGIAGAYAGGDMNRWSVVDTAADYYLA